LEHIGSTANDIRRLSNHSVGLTITLHFHTRALIVCYITSPLSRLYHKHCHCSCGTITNDVAIPLLLQLQCLS